LAEKVYSKRELDDYIAVTHEAKAVTFAIHLSW